MKLHLCVYNPFVSSTVFDNCIVYSILIITCYSAVLNNILSSGSCKKCVPFINCTGYSVLFYFSTCVFFNTPEVQHKADCRKIHYVVFFNTVPHHADLWLLETLVAKNSLTGLFNFKNLCLQGFSNRWHFSH